MNTQLKKGDRCQSPWGVVIVTNTYTGQDEVDLQTSSGEHRRYQSTHLLTRIPTHADRMQKIVDAAFDAENRLDDGETVQFRVGELAEFVRYHCKLREKCEAISESMKAQIIYINNGMIEIDRLLKGEL